MVTLRWLLLLVIVAVVETACGPIRSTAGLVDAQKMLQAAENEEADSVAQYEMTLARRYLDKAYEELGYNDYYTAEQMARKAEEHAEAALQKALGTELVDPLDAGPEIEQPDLEVIPEEGELDPNRRAGDEDAGDVVLEQDPSTPWATGTPGTTETTATETTPTETTATETTPTETTATETTSTETAPEETTPAEAKEEEKKDEETKEEDQPANPWQTNP